MEGGPKVQGAPSRGPKDPLFQDAVDLVCKLLEHYNGNQQVVAMAVRAFAEAVGTPTIESAVGNLLPLTGFQWTTDYAAMVIAYIATHPQDVYANASLISMRNSTAASANESSTPADSGGEDAAQ